MHNLAMKAHLDSGEALDVSGCPRTPAGDYILTPALAVAARQGGYDFCDATLEAWIWSIGEDLTTGQVLASTTTKFYQNPAFECLFLR